MASLRWRSALSPKTIPKPTTLPPLTLLIAAIALRERALRITKYQRYRLSIDCRGKENVQTNRIGRDSALRASVTAIPLPSKGPPAYGGIRTHNSWHRVSKEFGPIFSTPAGSDGMSCFHRTRCPVCTSRRIDPSGQFTRLVDIQGVAVRAKCHGLLAGIEPN